MTGTERKGKRSAFPPGAAQGCPTAAPAALCGVRVAVPLGSVRGSRLALRGANWGYTCDGCGNFANVLNRLPWLCVAGCRHHGTRSGRSDGYTIHRAALAVQWFRGWRCARLCPVGTGGPAQVGTVGGSGGRLVFGGRVPPAGHDGHAGGRHGGNLGRPENRPHLRFLQQFHTLPRLGTPGVQPCEIFLHRPLYSPRRSA